MKKNVMMRVASVLLIAVMMTTCAISGTFAKYVTANEASDSARVAKWGVTVSVTGEAFASKYEIKEAATDVADQNIEYSVVSKLDDDVVAPGTSGTFTGVSVTGTPEVAVEIKTEATLALTGWTLASGAFYCPITITVGTQNICGLDYDSAAKFIEAVEGAVEAANGKYQANTDLSTVNNLNGNYAWSWDFENKKGSVQEQTDGKDTELGNQAARGTANTISLTVKTTVTQID